MRWSHWEIGKKRGEERRILELKLMFRDQIMRYKDIECDNDEQYSET